MKEEKTTEEKVIQYLKETAYFTRKTYNIAQFFFYLVVVSGVLAVVFNVIN